MFDLRPHELQAQQAEICRRVNAERWADKFRPLPQAPRPAALPPEAARQCTSPNCGCGAACRFNE